MHHKLLGLESILLVSQVERVEPLVQGVVQSVVQGPKKGELESLESVIEDAQNL